MDPNIPTQPVQNETPVTQANLQQPINEIPSSGNKLKWILLIVVLLLFIFGGGTYYLRVKQVKQITPTPAIVQSTPTPTPDPTANWKTYKNTLYGYEFKYPSDIIPYDNNVSFATEPPRILIESAEKVNILYGPAGEDQLVFLIINTNKSAREWFNEDSKQYPEEVTAKEIFFAGKTAIEGNGIGGYNFPYRQLVVARNGYLMVISQVIENQMYNQILSTFKFTN